MAFNAESGECRKRRAVRYHADPVRIAIHANERRYLVILKGTADQHGKPVQVQVHLSPLCLW
ncbi:hypothetical protein E1N66_16030 [Pantoea allii]|nr:hypothetical protein E1N66_16030 [Pantoea allii]